MFENAIDYDNYEFKELQCSGEEFSEIHFTDCTFYQCSFESTVFHDCRFIDCVFNQCNLSLLTVSESVFQRVAFNNCKALAINWTEAAWQSIIYCPLTFTHCNISDSSFIYLDMHNMIATDCLAHNVDFRETNFSLADFQNTSFTGSLFNHTNLTKANLENAKDYAIDLRNNTVTKALFTLPEAMNLLYVLDIVIH